MVNVAEARDLKILPFEATKKVIDEIGHPIWVGFSGGEPTLPFCLPTLLKSIEYAKEKGSCTELFTNGSAGLKTGGETDGRRLGCISCEPADIES